MAKPKATILVVEDDEGTAQLVREALEADGYKVSRARSALEARSLTERTQPELVILDRGLPDKDGLDLCRELREKPNTRDLLILFLTSRASPTQKVLGLELGGDDYLAKPFRVEELLARVKALLRRVQRAPAEAAELSVGPIRMDLAGRIVKVGGKEVDLTPKEFDLLMAFLERPERVLTRQFLLTHVWGYDSELERTGKAVDMALVGLRRKLGRCGSCIEAVTGYGYRLRPPES